MAARKPRAKTSMLEWISATVGLALLLLVFAVLGRQAIRADTAEPPAIAVQALRVVPLAQGYLVEFEAANASTGTAAAVAIEGELTGADGKRETASAALDYVAGNARARGGLYFTSDPRRGELKLRALGYQEP